MNGDPCLARLAGLAGLLLTAAFGVSPVPGWAAEPIRIGEIESMTGKEAAYGQGSHRGLQLAVDEINARGGVLGRPLAVVVEDNQSKAGESSTLAKKLIGRDKVIAIVSGGISTNCLEIGPICQNARVPFVATTATNAKVTEVGNFVFRNCFTDDFQGAIMAKFARQTLQVRRVAVMTSASAVASVGLAKIFRASFVQLGGEIAIEQKYAEGDKDFRAQLTAIKASGPESLFVPAYYTEAALICRQARELGLTFPIFGVDSWEAPELLEIGGAALNGTYYSTHFTTENAAPAVTTFVGKFRARYAGATPDSGATLTYDALLILADAITRAGTTDGPKVRAALAATTNFPGVTGRTTIDPQRNASKDVVIIKVDDGQLKYIETITP